MCSLWKKWGANGGVVQNTPAELSKENESHNLPQDKNKAQEKPALHLPGEALPYSPLLLSPLHRLSSPPSRLLWKNMRSQFFFAPVYLVHSRY